MKSKINRALRLAAIMFVTAALIPLLALAGFSLRYALLALIPLAAGLILLVPSMRRRFTAPFRQAPNLDGFFLPEDRSLHPLHVWVKTLSGSRVRVGMDDFMQKLMGPVDHVLLPSPGERFSQGAAMVTLRRGTRSLSLAAPLSGTVRETNGAVSSDPRLVNRDPYGEGWILILEPDRLARELRSLLDAGSSAEWMGREVDRLRGALTSPSAARVLQDGGAFVDGLHAAVDDEKWQVVKSMFFEVPESGNGTDA